VEFIRYVEQNNNLFTTERLIFCSITFPLCFEKRHHFSFVSWMYILTNYSFSFFFILAICYIRTFFVIVGGQLLQTVKNARHIAGSTLPDKCKYDKDLFPRHHPGPSSTSDKIREPDSSVYGFPGHE